MEDNETIDYWKIAKNTKDIYMSDGVIATMLDFERVIDELDVYAFQNWDIGELIQGPEVNRYTIKCTFLWPREMMPDPRGAKRLLPFGCTVKYKKETMKVPVKVEKYTDFRPGSAKPKLIEKQIWLVEIEMPKHLINDIRTGSYELEDQDIDLDDLDKSYKDDLDNAYKEEQNA